MNKNILIGVLGILALLVIATGVWYVYFRISAPILYSVSNTPTTVLKKANQDYADAIAYEKAGKYDLAILSYEKALTNAQDQMQAGQIRMKIALMNKFSGNYKDAIAQFKAIAGDTSVLAGVRANAAQEIGLMNVNITAKDAHQIIFAETFKDAPYDSFRDSKNLNATYTKLFEYAVSLYPLGYSEARVAYGYAGEVINTLHGATTTPTGKAYLSLIALSIQAADADIVRMKQIPGEAMLVPDALVREGIALSRLASVGAGDRTLAETYFKSGLDYATMLGNRPGSFNAFNYAVFLSDNYGSKRSGDIKTLLLPFRAGNDAQIYSSVRNFLITARTDVTLPKSKKQIISLARIDSDFKTYLISLGWKASDF